jgi:hypothetical protein
VYIIFVGTSEAEQDLAFLAKLWLAMDRIGWKWEVVKIARFLIY